MVPAGLPDPSPSQLLRPERAERRLRVVRVIARLNVGGPAWHMMVLDLGLNARGWDTLVVHGRVGEFEESLEPELARRGVALYRIDELGPRVRPWSDLLAIVRLVRLLRRERPDVVHTHTAKAGALGRIAATLHNLTRPRDGQCLVVHTFHGHVLHGYFGAIGSGLVRQAERLLARLADIVVTLSRGQRQELVERFRVVRPDQAAVIPLGLELDKWMELAPSDPAAKERFGFPRDSIVFSVVGRMVPIKRPSLALDAFAHVHATVPQVRLLFAGDGELREHVQAAVTRYGLEREVRLAGWQSDLSSVYAATDVLLLTSRNEGTPVALIEAMAAGRAVVATAVGGVPDVVADGETGILVPDDDTAALEAAMTRLAHAPDRRAELGRAARASVGRYRSERLVDDIERLYRSALDQKRRVRRASK